MNHFKKCNEWENTFYLQMFKRPFCGSKKLTTHYFFLQLLKIISTELNYLNLNSELLFSVLSPAKLFLNFWREKFVISWLWIDNNKECKFWSYFEVILLYFNLGGSSLFCSFINLAGHHLNYTILFPLVSTFFLLIFIFSSSLENLKM